MNAELIGKAASALGAGREKAGDTIDFTAGIILKKKTGDFCKPGDPIAVLHTSDQKLLAAACAYLDNAITMSADKPADMPLIFGVVE